MTDKEQLLAIFEAADIKIEHGVGPGDHDGFQIGVSENRDNPAVIGYGGFYVSFHFDAEGNFLKVGAWE